VLISILVINRAINDEEQYSSCRETREGEEHRACLPGFSANFYVLNLCLQVFSIGFEHAINDEERYSGCRSVE